MKLIFLFSTVVIELSLYSCYSEITGTDDESGPSFYDPNNGRMNFGNDDVSVIDFQPTVGARETIQEEPFDDQPIELNSDSDSGLNTASPLRTLIRFAQVIRNRRQIENLQHHKAAAGPALYKVPSAGVTGPTGYSRNGAGISAAAQENKHGGMVGGSRDQNGPAASATSTRPVQHPVVRAVSGSSRPRKKLLIGYLAGTPFAGLGNNLLAKTGALRGKLNGRANIVERIPIPTVDGKTRNEQRGSGTAKVRRMAEPHPEPDAEPLETLYLKEGNNTVTLTFEHLSYMFQQSGLIGVSKFLQGHLISGAVRYAIEVVNNDPNLLPDYELTYKFFNTRGYLKDSVKSVMELWKMGAVAFIGPEDSCQTEAMIAAAQNLPMISYKCADHSVRDKTRYSTFARTVPADGEVAKAMVALLKQYNWHKFTIVAIEDEVHVQMVAGIKHWIANYPDMAIQNVTWYDSKYIIDAKASGKEQEQIVRQTYKNTRVYVVLGDKDFVQGLIWEMGNFGLLSKGEYVLIFIDHTYGYIDADDAALNRYFRPTIFAADQQSMQKPESLVQKWTEWSRSLFVIIPTPVLFSDPEYKKFWSKVSQYNTEEPFKSYKPMDKKGANATEPISNRYASYLYDAVMLYARALHETIAANESYTNGTAIMQRIFGRVYRSMQGFDVKIDSHGDAKGNFTLLTRQNISGSRWNFSHSMVPTGWFVDTEDPEGLPQLVLHDKMTIDWIGGRPPMDEPECGFNNEKCQMEPSRTAEIVGSVLALVALVGGLIGFMLYRNWKIEKELAGLIWKIDPKEIQFITQDGYAAVMGASRATLASQDSGGGQEACSLWPIDFHCLAKYRGALVAIKEIQYTRKLREITRATKMEMKKMRGLHQDNINNFMGIIVKSNQIYVVREYCAKGSLYDVLLNENIKLDELFTASFVDDLLKAMSYLHESELRVHGNLKSTNCVVTSRWSLQVSDYGLHELREGQQFENEMQRFKSLLWTAPELLLAGAIDRPQRGTQKGDVFSFGIVLHEIFSRTGPYGIESDCNFTPKDVYMLIVKTRKCLQCASIVQRGEEDARLLAVSNKLKPYLPGLDDLQCQNYVKETLLQCWEERPNERPDFRTIRQRLKPLFKGILTREMIRTHFSFVISSHGQESRRNIMDHMMAMMEKYQNHLEQLVDERTEALNEEKKRVETLLHRMLPDSVASQLMRGEDVIPESYDAVTIYFSDIVGFTSLSAESTPMEVVNFLNALYTLFDSIIRRYDVYKVETIGDAYMVVGGLPIRKDNHAGEIATMALHLLKAVETFQIPHRPDKKLLLRIGLHTGPCVAGVVGKTMPRYCLFGDTVNTASRLESNGMPLKIHCSEYVERALSALGGYILEERGLIPMKGKGEMLTYWLLAKQEFIMASPVDEYPTEPLFKTKDSARPPTGNTPRRRLTVDPLNQIPVRGESLTTVMRRTPSKRDGPSVLGSKLQPAPAFSSTAGKGPVAVGSGSSRNSRTLFSIAHDQSSIGAHQTPSEISRAKLAALLLAKTEMPPSYQDCISAASSKLSNLRVICGTVGQSRRDRKVKSQSTGIGECDNGLRKRSVSYPENMAALAEHFVALGLGKDGCNLLGRDANGNVTASSSLASSVTHTPSVTPACRRHYTRIPDRGQPSSGAVEEFFSRPVCQCHDHEQLSRAPNEQLATWEVFENGCVAMAANATNGSKRKHPINIFDSDDEEDGSPALRKRSLSCGDASDLAMMCTGPTSLTDAMLAASQPQHIEIALTTPVIPPPLNNVRSQGLENGLPLNPGILNQAQDSHFHPMQRILRMESQEADSPPDSPLLSKAGASIALSGLDSGSDNRIRYNSGSNVPRHYRKRKSAVSLHAFSHPFQSFWPGQDATAPEMAVGLTTGAVRNKQISAGKSIGRLLRYLKRPLSEDQIERSEQRVPSLV